MHGGTGLTLSIQLSPADSYSCRLWREVLGVVLKQVRADLRSSNDAEAFFAMLLTRCAAANLRRPAVWSRASRSCDAPSPQPGSI